MTLPRFLPARPSMESIRKQAKRLARDHAAGRDDAVARVKAQLPQADLPLTQRDAQLVLAREYGFAGWRDLRAEVLKRTGESLEWAAVEAKRAIHDGDAGALELLLAEYPALLSWRDALGWSLLRFTAAFSDSFDPEREETYNRPDCAALLIDAGAVVDPAVCRHVIDTRARGMLRLLWDKGVLPPSLTAFAALGDADGVRACLDEPGDRDRASAAFMTACHFKHMAIAALLLDRCIADDAALGRRIAKWGDRAAFIAYLGEHPQDFGGPWRSLVMHEAMRAIRDDDLAAFTGWLDAEPDLLGDAGVTLQVELLEHAALHGRGAFIALLLDRGPAVLRHRPRPPSSALGFALEYGHSALVPLLARIWPLPDDLPHAAGVGDLAGVKRWFDDAGRPMLGNPADHHPGNCPQGRANLQWGAPNAQHSLDVALAWACLNGHFAVADFLLAHGADIDTNWSTHEPASILHEAVIQQNRAAAEFLVARGIDLTIRCHRWNGTAAGWAYNATKDAAMFDYLQDAEAQRAAGQGR